MRFMHLADIHLGYQQYGLKERFNDFSRVFLHMVDEAAVRQVDFVLLAGDLFEKRTVDPLAMRVAIEGLGRLQEAGIPLLAVEGNHERAYYQDQFSWVEFLDALGYVRLLNPRFERDRAFLEPHGAEGGAYVDLPGGVRVYGIKYYGAATGKVLNLFAEALAEMDHSDVKYTILMAHTGLEGQMERVRGCSYNDLAPLRERVDYIALGHYHKPFAVENWLFNPGSPETCGMDEVAWPKRGYYLVDIRPGQNPRHRAQLIATPRRPFYRFTLPVDTLDTPKALYDAVRALIRREAGGVAREPQPVIELTLSGTLHFNRYELDLAQIQGLLAEAWSPLGQPRVVNKATPAQFEIVVDTEASRPELERTIIQGLLARDGRFRGASDAWTEGVLELKRLALGGSPPDGIVDFLQRLRAEAATTAEAV